MSFQNKNKKAEFSNTRTLIALTSCSVKITFTGTFNLKYIIYEDMVKLIYNQRK